MAKCYSFASYAPFPLVRVQILLGLKIGQRLPLMNKCFWSVAPIRNNEEMNAIREGVRALCAEFPAE